MTVGMLRVREPVNNGRRNNRTSSREPLATVLDVNAQQTPTILARQKSKMDGAAPSTLPVLRKSLSFSSRQVLWRSADELKPMSRATSFRSIRRDRCEFFVAKRNIDYCQKCTQWDQEPEPKMWASSARSVLCWTPRTGVIGTAWCASALQQTLVRNTASVLSHAIWTKFPCTSSTSDPHTASTDT